jgi:hypothetical protein
VTPIRLLFNQFPGLGLSLVGLLALATSCATRHSLYRDYQSTLREGTPRPSSRHTRVIILVDGLGLDVARARLQARALPRTETFFTRFQAASAVFPTLTYPNIASILTGLPIERHAVQSNAVLFGMGAGNDGHEVDFESPRHRDLLNQLLAGQTHFARLTQQGRTSVSFSHSFHSGATTFVESDLKSGLAYVAHDYDYIDRKAIRGLSKLLEDTSYGRWPELIFLHLSGYDSLAHQHGPYSRQALSYLSWLDGELDEVYALLAKAEAEGHSVQALLSSDHGFETVTRSFPIERALEDLPYSVVNQYRVAALYSSEPGTSLRAQSRFAELAAQPEILAVVAKSTSSRLRLFAKRALDRASIALIENALKSPSSPQALVIAESGVSFEPIGPRHGRGQHGGLSASELQVPVLTRGAEIAAAPGAPTYALVSAFVQSASPPRQSSPESETATSAASFESSGEGAVGHRLELSAPVTRSMLLFENGGSKIACTSDFTPGLNIDWKQNWSDLFSTRLGYGLRFYDFNAITSASASSKLGAHEFRLGTGFRASSSQTISLGIAYGEEPWWEPGSLEVSSTWLPRLDFGTRRRLWSLGIGDLSLEGGLSALLASGGFRLGFQQNFGAHLETSVGDDHVLRIGVIARHFSQSTTSNGARSGWDLGLGTFYSLGL